MQPIRKGYITISDGQMHYREREGTGSPVVFLHQTASSGAMWEKVMMRWPERHWLYALDTPGFGGSFDPEIVPGMENYENWIIEAVDGLGIGDFHLVGHHTGAAIAAGVARKCAMRVLSLGLIGPSFLTEEERVTFAEKIGRPFKPNRSGAYLLQNWEYLKVGGAGKDILLLHREMTDMLRAWESRPHAYSAVWAQDFKEIFMELTCPIRIMAATDDMLFPYLQRAGDARPDVSVVELASGSNFEPDLSPDEVTKALSNHVMAREKLSS